MKKILISSIVILICLLFSSVQADESLPVKHGESYMCGDSFEIIFPDQPSTTSMNSHNIAPRLNVVYAEAGKNDRLFQIRIKIRNLTPTIFQDLSSKSFQLTGFVRNRYITYTPEVMEPYDEKSYEAYAFYSPNHIDWTYLPPLRMNDILLVFRVNPILVNWELRVNPRANKGTSYEYGSAVYSPMDLEPCDAVFQFQSIRNAETGAVTNYVRK